MTEKNKSICTADTRGDRIWRNAKGELHNEEGPAIVRRDGTKAWALNGRTMDEALWRGTLVHRQVEAAMSTKNESTCTTAENGAKFWRNAKGELHNEHGPAIVDIDGNKYWFLDGVKMGEAPWQETLLHRQVAYPYTKRLSWEQFSAEIEEARKGLRVGPFNDEMKDWIRTQAKVLHTGRTHRKGPELQYFPVMHVHDEIGVNTDPKHCPDYKAVEMSALLSMFKSGTADPLEMLATLFLGSPTTDKEQDEERAKRTKDWRVRARRAATAKKTNAKLLQETLGRLFQDPKQAEEQAEEQAALAEKTKGHGVGLGLGWHGAARAKHPTGIPKDQLEAFSRHLSQGPKRGKLIVIEGIDGAGTTAQAKLTAEWLGAELTCEPSGLLEPIIREYLDPKNPRKAGKEEMAVLFTAAKILNKHDIENHLAAGRNVVSDRHTLSTLVYQGDLAPRGTRNGIRWLTKMLHTPDHTFILDVDIETAFKRIADRKSLDMYEGDREMQDRLRTAYRRVSYRIGLKGSVIDGSESIEKVQRRIRTKIQEMDIETCHSPAVEELFDAVVITVSHGRKAGRPCEVEVQVKHPEDGKSCDARYVLKED